MRLPNVPTPAQILARLQPILPALYAAAESGAAQVQAFFGDLGKEIDRNLAPDLLRYAAKEYLDQSGHDTVDEGRDYEREGQPRNGLLVSFDGLDLRILKFTNGGPPAAASDRRRAFYARNAMLDFGNVESDAATAHFALLVLWEADSAYRLLRLWLVLPRDKDEKNYYWMEEIQHPAFSIKPPEPKPEPEAEEDLPIAPKKKEKTGDDPDEGA